MKHFKWETPPSPIPEAKITARESADIVIIGAGHAGTCAVRAAAEAGASVIVIEQQSDEHQWVLGIGEMGYMNSAWQRAHGVPEVDIDTFLNDWQLRTNNRANYRLIRRYAENCGDCFDWFIEPLSAAERESIHPMMTPLSENMPETQNGIHAWSGTPDLGVRLMRKAVKENQRLAAENGARFLFETRAEQLIVRDGRVTGVIARSMDGSHNKVSHSEGSNISASLTDGSHVNASVRDGNCVNASVRDGNYVNASVRDGNCVNASVRDGNYVNASVREGTYVNTSVRDGNCVNASVTDETYIKIEARKGVILAAGDYSKNREMCEDLLSECADLLDEGDFLGHGWDGSGIRMGVWAGGRLEPRPQPSAGGNYSFPGFDTIGSTACLRLNAHGKRYSNEGFGNHVLAAIPGARQPNGMLWSIFDSNILTEVTYQAPCNACFDYTDPERVRRFTKSLALARASKGTPVMNKDQAGDSRPICCAETIEELAAAIYPDPDDQRNMIESVRRYNGLCERGQDTDFGKEPHLMHPITKGPFYASGQYKDSHRPFGQSMKILVTVGGLLTDENQNVLNRDFEPIPGLFATGNCCGGRFGLHYSTSIPGQSISMAETLGREVGRYLAQV